MGIVAWALCARCGEQIGLQPSSRPVGEATCRDCWLQECTEATKRTEALAAQRKAAMHERACAWCGLLFTTKNVIKVYCSPTCQGRAKKSGPCAGCGKPMILGSTSLPVGQATCQPCRRERNKVDLAAKAAQAAAHRARSAERRTRKRVYKTKTKSTERGYGWEHQKARQRYLAEMQEGDPCARCGEPMSVTEPLDLDHNPDRTGYLGLSHRSCNRAAHGGKPRTPCPVCGGKRPSSKQVTCGRACGWEWRRLNAA